MNDALFTPAERFEDAASMWLQFHGVYVERGTVKFYRDKIRALKKVFSDKELSQITDRAIADYQRLRITGSAPFTRKGGPETVNRECNALSQILKAAGLEPKYRKFPVKPSSLGRALLPEEEKRLFETAALFKRWQVAYWASIISANTTAGPGEIRNLRLSDVDVLSREINIRQGTKNKYRVRTIPLNEAALWAITQVIERAHRLGASRPEHYIFPGRTRSKGKHSAETHDVTKPIGNWKQAWYALTEAAGLKGLRRYDLRHHAITQMLENPNVSEQTVKDMAGHVSKRILETYSHIRKERKREAVTELENPSLNIPRARVRVRTGLLLPPGGELPLRISAPLSAEPAGQFQPTNDTQQRDVILNALQMAKGNRREAAKLLGISASTLWSRLFEYGITTRVRRLSPIAPGELTGGEGEREAIETALAQVQGDRHAAAKLLGVSPSTLWTRLHQFGMVEGGKYSLTRKHLTISRVNGKETQCSTQVADDLKREPTPFMDSASINSLQILDCDSRDQQSLRTAKGGRA
jgi:integrase/DNA-binding protein Fis